MEKSAVPEGTWKVICSASSAVWDVFLPSLSAHYYPNCVVQAVKKAHGPSLGCQPQAASSRVEVGETRQARAGVETQWFFWELAEVQIQGVPKATGDGCGGGEGSGDCSPAVVSGDPYMLGEPRMDGERKDRNCGCQDTGTSHLLYSGVLIVDPHGMKQLSPQHFVILGRHFASLSSHFSSTWTVSVFHKVVQVGAQVS